MERTRELERALGSAEKKVAENERETILIQRRCLRAARDLTEGTTLTRGDIEVLRPAPLEAIPPFEIVKVVGRRVRTGIRAGEHLTWTKLEQE